MESGQLQTKKCPFCGETVQALAIKCRYCAEFLNTEEAKALEADPLIGEDEKIDDNILFQCRPSLLAMVGSIIKAIFVLAGAVFLIVYPIEQLPIFQSGQSQVLEADSQPTAEPQTSDTLLDRLSHFALTEQQVLIFKKCRLTAGISLWILVLLVVLLKMLRLKMMFYEVTADRIEYSRGILDRRVDNLDMFRVVDLRLRRSLLDCMLGIGTVSLVTTDKSDPQFTFKKVRHSRELYNVIKQASLQADQKQRVVHLQ